MELMCNWYCSSVPNRGIAVKEVVLRQKPVENGQGPLIVPVELKGIQIVVVVDTAAEVTVVTADLIFGHRPKLKCKDTVKLVNAEKGSKMIAKVARRVSLRIGSHKVRQKMFMWHLLLTKCYSD